jgi:hypothetical protein
MTGEQDSSKQRDEITRDELVRSTLGDKVRAIAECEDIIWKIRSGYVVILYGGLTLFFGKEGINMDPIRGNPDRLFPLLILVCGLSFSVFLIDFGYVRKKLKITVVRDKLVEHVLDKSYDRELKHFLRIAGESKPSTLPSNLHPKYKEIRNWTFHSILLPIYITTPVIVLMVYLWLLLDKYIKHLLKMTCA